MGYFNQDFGPGIGASARLMLTIQTVRDDG